MSFCKTHIKLTDVDAWRREWGGELYDMTGSEHAKGEMILIRKHFDSESIKTIHTEERLLGISFKHQSHDFYYFCVYSPNKTQEKMKHYKRIQSILQQYMNITGHVILSGNFNCIYNADLDNLAGAPHPHIEREQFQDLIEATDLHDLWRYHHENETNFTYKRKLQPIVMRVDYIFVNQYTLDCGVSCEIIDIPFSDHRGVIMNTVNDNIEQGPGYWKINDTLLKDEYYVKHVNDIIKVVYDENYNILNIQTLWDICKKRVQMLTSEYGKHKSRMKNIV
jgi:exonuclease III